MSKKPQIEAPDDLPNPDKRWLYEQCKKRPELRRWANRRDIQHMVDRCLAHHGSKDNRFADWRRACWNWILKQQELDSKPRAPYRTQERDPFDHRWQKATTLEEELHRMGMGPPYEH